MRLSKLLAAFALCAGLLTGLPAAAVCTTDTETIGARYRVELLRTGQGAFRKKKEFDFTLWRDGDRVAHELPASGLVEVWHRGAQSNLRLVRTFEKYRSGIVFFSDDMAIRDPGLLWESKRHIVPVSLLGLSLNQEADCDFTETVERRRVTATLRATWFPATGLVERYQRITPGAEVRFSLIDVITDRARISAFFEKGRAFELIDWSDVGDREGDQLVAGMLAIGGIPHSISGFTDRHIGHQH